MKVVFLDVDGVILPIDNSPTIQDFNSGCMNHLKRIVEESDAHIVISSTWRTSKFDRDLLMHQLDKVGLKDRVIGDTPDLVHLADSSWDDDAGCFISPDNWDEWQGTRGHEISEWLKVNKVKKFVILDDDPQAAQPSNPKNGLFIHTDMAIGLLDFHADKAIDFLSRK